MRNECVGLIYVPRGMLCVPQSGHEVEIPQIVTRAAKAKTDHVTGTAKASWVQLEFSKSTDLESCPSSKEVTAEVGRRSVTSLFILPLNATQLRQAMEYLHPFRALRFHTVRNRDIIEIDFN